MGTPANPLSQTERDQLVSDLSGGQRSRADVLRAIAENPTLVQAEFNRAFVLMQYFGYLRRNPNDAPDGTSSATTSGWTSSTASMATSFRLRWSRPLSLRLNTVNASRLELRGVSTRRITRLAKCWLFHKQGERLIPSLLLGVLSRDQDQRFSKESNIVDNQSD